MSFTKHRDHINIVMFYEKYFKKIQILTFERYLLINSLSYLKIKGDETVTRLLDNFFYKRHVHVYPSHQLVIVHQVITRPRNI